MNAVRRGLAGFVRDLSKCFAAISKLTAGAREGQREGHGRAGYGTMVVVFNANYRIVRQSLSNTADYAFSFDNDNRDARGRKILGMHRQSFKTN